jgi:anti-sigma B factor antagonist
VSDLKISTRENGGVIVVDLAGRIALGETSANLHQTLKNLVNDGKGQILLNLADVTTIDSSGLGTLVAGYTSVETNGGQLKLANLSDRTSELMTITKLYTVFEIFDNERAAINSFGQTGESAATV